MPKYVDHIDHQQTLLLRVKIQATVQKVSETRKNLLKLKGNSLHRVQRETDQQNPQIKLFLGFI